MNAQVKFHPAEELLIGFANGTLSPGMNVVISAHIEQCAMCREKTSKLEAQATVEWLKSTESVETDKDDSISAPNFSHLVADITSQPQQRERVLEDDSVSEIHMLDHSVKLPKVLAKVASKGLVWKKLAGGINQASVTLDDQTQCEFLYMKPGSQVPVHKHQGTEVTLVLDGSFSDEMGKYEKSDFVVRDKSHTHQPASEEGCLCFAVLDSPLTFTSGLARLLNPFLRYRFKRATSMG
ncbi:MAG: ChrR family anti-sigma-E factor [Pseudomonadales bacterium]|nr:ChrR family anti-sigma-E factor [Pseudomonadales bacterium]